MDGDVVWVSNLVGSPPSSPFEPAKETGDFYLAPSFPMPATPDAMEHSTAPSMRAP